jgi:hypothetical protein
MKKTQPPGLLDSGRALWEAVTARLDLDTQEEQLLREACRVIDGLDALDRATRREDATDAIKLLQERRQQQSIFARLIASLRLPDDLNNPEHRPQRRGAIRTTYHERGSKA